MHPAVFLADLQGGLRDFPWHVLVCQLQLRTILAVTCSADLFISFLWMDYCLGHHISVACHIDLLIWIIALVAIISPI